MRTTDVMLLTLAALASLLLAREASAAPAETAERRQQTERWQKMFGKDIDFADVGLHLCMDYVCPQPEKAFQDLDDKKYVPALLIDSAYWTGQFFRKPYRPDVRKDQPEKYYLPKKPDETGLVLHEWTTPEYAFTAQEGGNGVLVRIVPKGYDPTKPLTGKELADLLFDVFGLPYASADAVAAAFKLPKTAPAGTTFTNAKNLRDVWRLGDWKHFVVGFIGDDAIYVICYKSNPGRMAAGFASDGMWLNRGLMEKDGKTLVAPPPPSPKADGGMP